MARKICPFLLIIVTLLACACIPDAKEDCIVRIMCDGDEVNVCGTGFLLQGGYILTAAHILAAKSENSNACTVLTSVGKKYAAEIIGINADYDLALLSSDRNNGMNLATADPTCGTRAYVWGASGKVLSTVIGVRDCVAPEKPPVLIQLDAYLPKGISGAPVVSSSGSVIGMICARSIDGEASYAVPVTTVKAFIKGVTE